MPERSAYRWPRALVEFLVIILGVLVALGVDQWRESARDRQLEQEYLVRLVADLNDTRASVMSTIQDFDALIDHGVAVSRVLSGIEPFPADTLGFLASALQVSRGGYDPAVSRGAYDDLISTGNLRVMRDEALRYRLSAFYGSVYKDISPIDYSADKMPYRFSIRGLLTLETQLLIRAQCDGAPPLSCPAYAGAGGLQEMVEDILDTAQLRRELTVHLQGMAIRSLTDGVTGGFTPVLQRIDQLLVLVQASAS